MPEISRFHGIRIVMYPDDHPPPHFHAAHADGAALIEIAGPRVHESDLPPRLLTHVCEWAAVHRDELADNWNRVRAGLRTFRIAPLA